MVSIDMQHNHFELAYLLSAEQRRECSPKLDRIISHRGETGDKPEYFSLLF